MEVADTPRLSCTSSVHTREILKSFFKNISRIWKYLQIASRSARTTRSEETICWIYHQGSSKVGVKRNFPFFFLTAGRSAGLRGGYRSCLVFLKPCYFNESYCLHSYLGCYFRSVSHSSKLKGTLAHTRVWLDFESWLTLFVFDGLSLTVRVYLLFPSGL